MVHAINIALVLASVWMAANTLLFAGVLKMRFGPNFKTLVREHVPEAEGQNLDAPAHLVGFVVLTSDRLFRWPVVTICALVLARMAVR